MKHPSIVEEYLAAGDNNRHAGELKKRVGSLKQKIDQAEAKIRRIQEGYEADPPLYTAKEAEERIRAFRDLIARTKKEQQRLQNLMEQQVLGEKTMEMMRRRLEEVRDENLENASFSEKQDLFARLGIMVYPSEDHKTVRIASKLTVRGDKISPQIMSMASPILTFRHEISNVETFIEMTLVGMPAVIQTIADLLRQFLFRKELPIQGG